MKPRLAMMIFLPLAAIAADTNEVQLLPPHGELPPTLWEQHHSAILAGTGVVAILAALAIRQWLRPKPARVLPPEQIARAALQKLASQAEDGKVVSAVSQILRRYPGAVLDFPGGEMTTAEFIAALARHDRIAPQLGAAIAGFLRECDARKFSPAKAGPPLHAANRALEFIAQTREPAPIPIPK